jgi:hypothetical protein
MFEMNWSDIMIWAQQSQMIILGFNLFLTILIIFLVVSLRRKLKKFRFLLKNSEDKNLEQILLGLSEKMTANSQMVEQVIADLTEYKEQSKYNLQKWALVRFKAFNNIGGDQSFALALMDSYGDGLVISSIFGREESVVYCKPIKEGVSVYPLSKEEQAAINQAIGIKKK